MSISDIMPGKSGTEIPCNGTGVLKWPGRCALARCAPKRRSFSKGAPPGLLDGLEGDIRFS